MKEDLEYLGDKDILNNYKIGFLCSRKVPSSIILKTYDWAIAQRDAGKCIVSGFHSKMERDVLHYLLKGTQPIIIVLARGMYEKLPQSLVKEFDKGRMLIITPFKKYIRRISEEETYKRSESIIRLSNEVVIPYVSPEGQLNKLLENVSADERNKIHFL
jgi:hypothetical protein